MLTALNALSLNHLLMLRLTDLTFERGDDVLFSGLDGVVYPGQRMAVVG